jgi:hypothetical protein
MIKNDKLKWLNVIFWLASVGAMIGLMIGLGRYLDDSDIGLLIEFVIITIVTLAFLYLISGKKTFTYLTNETGYTTFGNRYNWIEFCMLYRILMF